MKKLVRKDTINRNILYKYETKRFVLKNIIKNQNLSLTIRWKALLKLSKILKQSSSIYNINRCIFTGRKKRINSFYSFSRIMFLKFARFGYFNGLKKSSW